LQKGRHNVEWNLNGKGPIWLQLADHLRLAIVTGVYPLGEKLPSVRDLASEAAVNPNTMQRALVQLEADGLAVTNRTNGRTVTEDEAVIKKLRSSMAKEKAETYLGSMKTLGFEADEAMEMLSNWKEY